MNFHDILMEWANWVWKQVICIHVLLPNDPSFFRLQTNFEPCKSSKVKAQVIQDMHLATLGEISNIVLGRLIHKAFEGKGVRKNTGRDRKA